MGGNCSEWAVADLEHHWMEVDRIKHLSFSYEFLGNI